MAVFANVAGTDLFSTWRTRFNQSLKRLNAFAIDESSLYANTLTANVSFTSKGLTTLQGRATVGTNLSVTGNTSTNKATVTSALTVSGNTTLGGWTTITTANAVFDGSTTNPLIRITQRGTGDVLRIEDSTTTDTTPLVIKADGIFVKGTSNAYSFYSATNQYTPGFQTHAISSALASWGQYGWNGVTPIHAFAVSNTAINSYGAVAPGETLGLISFTGANNSAFTEGARILGIIPTGAITTGQYIPVELRFATSPGGSTATQNRFFIYSNGHSYFTQTLAVNQNFTVNGNTVLGNSNTADRTTISGLTTVKGRQLVTANFTVQGNTTLGGTGKTTSTTGLLAHTGRATISTNLAVSGNTTVAGLIANNSLGTANYILKTNGTTVFWGAAPAAGGAKGGGSDQVFWENDATITSNYTLTAGENIFTQGPLTINNGVTITVPAGTVWRVEVNNIKNSTANTYTA
jgi:hypothetical protein